MRTFVGKIGLFIFLFVIVNILVGRIVLLVVGSETRLMRTEQQFQSGCGKDANIMFFGDSHVQNSVDPSVIQNSFNFSSSGENYIQTYYKVKYVLQERKDIRTIVLPFDAHSFSGYRAEEIMSMWYWRRYIDVFDVLKNTRQYTYMWAWLLSFAPHLEEPALANRFVRNTFSKTSVESPMHCGFLERGTSVDINKLPSIAADRVRYHMGGGKLLHPTLRFYFERILELASKHNVDVVLVRYPVTDYYRDLAQTFNAYVLLDTYADSLHERFDNIRMVDFRDIFSTQYELFRDSDHLNEQGAEMFSEALNARLY